MEPTRLLELVRDDATDEMGLRGVQRLHQSVELFLRVDIERSSNQRPIQIFFQNEKKEQKQKKKGATNLLKKKQKNSLMTGPGRWGGVIKMEVMPNGGIFARDHHKNSSQFINSYKFNK